jgi:hypothetical protein
MLSCDYLGSVQDWYMSISVQTIVVHVISVQGLFWYIFLYFCTYYKLFIIRK